MLCRFYDRVNRRGRRGYLGGNACFIDVQGFDRSDNADHFPVKAGDFGKSTGLLAKSTDLLRKSMDLFRKSMALFEKLTN